MLIESGFNLTNFEFYINLENSTYFYQMSSQLSSSNSLNFGFTESLDLGRSQYFLASSEFLDDGKLIGFQLHAWTKGEIYLSLLSFSFCGLNTDCRSYFDNLLYYETFNELHTWKINVENGLNLIRLPYGYKVKKGNVLMLKQNSTGRVSIDSSTDFFEDYMINFLSPKYFLTQLDMNKKLRFCLNPIIDHMFYLSYLSFDLSFVGERKFEANFSIDTYSINKKFNFDPKGEF